MREERERRNFRRRASGTIIRVINERSRDLAVIRSEIDSRQGRGDAEGEGGSGARFEGAEKYYSRPA